MTLKNSFWASMKEDNKRRIWLWLLSALSYDIFFPTIVAMMLSRIRTREEYLVETMGEALGHQAAYNMIVEQMEERFGLLMPYLWILAAGFAIISAIQGFSYLYSKKKMDFYMGLPVKRSKRFLIIWMNGILVYLLPYLLGILLGWLILAGNGVMTLSIVKEAMLAFGLFFLFYLGIYHLAILAVMMTGNLNITCCGIAVFLLYEWGVREVICAYMQMFFKFFSYHTDIQTPLLSPFSILADYADKHEAGMGNGIITAGYLLLFAAAAGLLGYICYMKRPSEAAGKAMSFKITQPVIKILLVVPAALLAGYVASDVVGYNPIYGDGSAGFMIFVMAVAVVVLCCLIQVIYEFDLKGIFHRKHHILISAAATVMIFIIFRYDLFGYDTYIPPAEGVSSVAIITPYEYSYYGGESYYDNDTMHSITKYDYVMENMYLTDVGAVNKLFKLSMDTIDKYDNLEQLYGSDEEAEWYTMTILYRMNNKRNISRAVMVNVKDPEVCELLDRIEGSEEYIHSAYMGASGMLDKLLADEKLKINISYGNSIYQQKMSTQEALELLALYKEDIKGSTFSMIRENIHTGSMVIEIEEKNTYYTTYYDMEVRIYPFLTGCVEYLKELGLYSEFFVHPEDVERIQVTNHNYKLQEKTKEQWNLNTTDPEELLAMGKAEAEAEVVYSMDASEFIRYANYNNEADIKEICNSIYPENWLGTSWHAAAEREEDYRITIYFKPESATQDNGYVGNFVFVAGKVPEFVRRDTAYGNE